MKNVQLEEITTKISFKILNLRAINRIIRTEEFQSLHLTDQEKELVREMIEKADKEAFKTWIKQKRKTHDQTIRALRAKARILGVPNWYNLDQQSLLYATQNEYT